MAITKSNTNKGGVKTTSVSKFSLPDKKVTLVPILRKSKFMGSENHDGAFMYTGATYSWTIFRDQYGNYIDPLTPAERVFLEKELDEDLNVEHKVNYWKEFEFKIKKDVYNLDELKRVLDLSKPKDYLAYKLLLTVPDIANSLKEKDNNPLYKFALVEKDEPIQSKLTKGKLKSKCYAWLSNNSDKTSSLRNILYVLNINIARDITKDELESILIDVIEGTRLAQLSDLIDDDGLEGKILFAKALRAKQITIRNGKYYNSKNETIGSDKNVVIDWLNSPENSAEVAMIKAAIEKLKL